MQDHRDAPRYALLEAGGEGQGLQRRATRAALRRGLLSVAAGVTLLLWMVHSTRGHGKVLPQLFPDSEASAYQQQLSKVLRFPRPHPTLRGQLVDGLQYIMTMYFGGQANQALAIINLLYIAKGTGRVAVLPQFTALHFGGSKRRVDSVYDLARFYDETGVVAVALPTVKMARTSLPVNAEEETIPCWSTMEIRTGSSNWHPPTSPEENGLWDHLLKPTFWAVPPLRRARGDYVVSLGAVIDYLKDTPRQLEYVERAKKEFLPQKGISRDVDASTIDRKTNIKSTFDPSDPFPPTLDPQFTCVDATYFMGESVPPPPYPQGLPLDSWRTRELWTEVGQHLHFSREVEAAADEYLMRIFGVGRLDDVPPFISVHIRRTDFKGFKGLTYTSLESYQNSIAEVKDKLQDLLDLPIGADLKGKPSLRRFSNPPGDYKILITTDEPAGTPFRQELAATGWCIIDHAHFDTVKKLGPWWPSMLDGELLARGQGFVGTQWSTFSLLAGQRVEYWQGGAQTIAQPGKAEEGTAWG